MDATGRIGLGALLALMLATGGALAQESHEAPGGEGEEIALDDGGDAGGEGWEGDLDYAEGDEEVVEDEVVVDAGGEDDWIDEDDGEIVTVDGEFHEGEIVGEDLGEAHEGGPGRLAAAGADDRNRSEWSQGRLAWALRSLGGDRAEDASQDAPVMTRAARAQPDRSGTLGNCASEDFRGALFCDLQR